MVMQVRSHKKIPPEKTYKTCIFQKGVEYLKTHLKAALRYGKELAKDDVQVFVLNNNNWNIEDLAQLSDICREAVGENVEFANLPMINNLKIGRGSNPKMRIIIFYYKEEKHA